MTSYAYYFDATDAPRSSIKERIEEHRKMITDQDFLESNDRLIVLPSNFESLQVVYENDTEDSDMFSRFGLEIKRQPQRFVLTVNVGNMPPLAAEKYVAAVTEAFKSFKRDGEKALILQSRTSETYLQVIGSTVRDSSTEELLTE